MLVDSFTQTLQARKRPGIIGSENYRVILRPYLPSPERRISNIVEKIFNLDEREAKSQLDHILQDFSNRHRNFRTILDKHYGIIEHFIDKKYRVTPELRLLIGAYFTCEYSVEAAALFNPSMVLHPDQSRLPAGSTRFIMSFRAVGEGHISSIEFRSGIIDRNNDVFFDPTSRYIEPASIFPDKVYKRDRFRMKLTEMSACNEVTTRLLGQLPASFTFSDLKKEIESLEECTDHDPEHKANAIQKALWLARSNYEIKFDPQHNISERAIFPVSESQRGGIEDARFVRFVDDDGKVYYYATYTAYDGSTIMPQLIETRDFVSFHIITLNGKAVQNKGMALFPRKIHGQYVMLSRQDGENSHVMFSDNLHFWETSTIFQRPLQPWEFIQIGNCGSPVETEKGWLVLTHGVGAMRRYSIGLQLLDLDNPGRITGTLKQPVLVPSAIERDGYVPNVVYSCGGMIHDGEFIIPYAFGDQHTRLAMLPLDEIFAHMEYL